MTKYEKIARWIASQNVDRTPNDKDIKEIAEMVFDEKLTSTGVKYVKEELSKIDSENPRITDSNSLVGKKISWDRRALYGVILSENDPLTNKTSIEETSTGKVYFVSTRLLNKAIDKGEAKLRDSKFKDSKAQITVWLINKNSKKDLDIICKALNVVYKILKETPTELKIILKGSSADIEAVVDDLRSLRMMSTSLSSVRYTDAKFKDGYKSDSIKELYDEGMYVEDIHDILDRVYPDYINTESLNDVPDKVWDKVYDALEKRLRERYKENPKDVLTKAIGVFNLDDSKFKDSNSYAIIKEDKYYDPEGLNIDDNEKNILYVGGTKQECLIELEILHKEMKDKYSRDESVSVSPITGSQFYVYFRNAISKDYYRVVEMHPNRVKDSKLTRKQKLWYGEELEKFINPQYLRRNYQLNRLKSTRKTKGKKVR